MFSCTGMHAYAMLVKRDGSRVKFSSAFRLLFFMGGVPKRLKRSVEGFAEQFEPTRMDEFERQFGAGWMGRFFGGG